MRRPVIVSAWISVNQPFNQLPYVVNQLHHQSKSWDVSPKSFLLGHIIEPPLQLSRAGPRWHASTPVGLHRHFRGYPPFTLVRLPSQEISSTVLLQDNTWNISAAQSRGGAIDDSCALYTHIYSSCLDAPEVTGTSSIVPISTSRVSKSSSNAGAIAGGVVGGVFGMALITGVVAWLFVRRRRARSPPSDMGGQREGMVQPVTVAYPSTIGTPRLYVSDSLFPLPQQRCATDLVVCVSRTLRIQRRTRAKSTCQ